MPNNRPKNASVREQAASRWLNRPALDLLLCAALSLALYTPALWNTWVTDDESEVLQDQLIRSFRNFPALFAHNVWYFAGSETHNYYRPLKLLAYTIEYHLFGFQPVAWHVAGILLQIAVVISTYVLIRDLASRQLAFWTALWFAIHPVHVEVVAWVAGGQDALCALALLLSVWCYHRARSSAAPLWLNGISATLFLAGLFAKEAALTFPAVILAYDYLYRRESLRQMLRAWARYIPMWAALGVYILFRIHALNGFAPKTTGMDLTTKELILSVPVLAAKYLGLVLIPAQLNYWHNYVPVRALGWQPLAAMALIIAMVAAVFWLRRAQPMLAFALAWFWITLVPVLAIPKVSGNVFTERYVYVPSFAFCVFAAWSWLWIQRRARSSITCTAARAVLAAVFVFYAVVIVRRLPDWHDTLTLLERTVQQSPDSPYVNGAVGYVYFQQDRYDDALKFELRAVEDDPHVWTSWMNLGAIYNAQQRWAQAQEACRRGLAINPDNAMLLNQAGLALWLGGRPEEGLASWRRSVQLDPTDLTARVNLATGFYQLGQIDAAQDQLLAGLRSSMNPRMNPDPQALYVAHFKLGDIYGLKRDWQAAAGEYQQVLQLKPDLAAAREQLDAMRAHLASAQP